MIWCKSSSIFEDFLPGISRQIILPVVYYFLMKGISLLAASIFPLIVESPVETIKTNCTFHMYFCVVM
jgi:hypothetical protein